MRRDAALRQSLSTTSRSPRGPEKDGVDYYFVSEAEFVRRIDAGMFVEHAQFGGSRYGTEVRNIDLARAANADLLLAIDVQGADALKSQFPEMAVTICVFPPSFAVLEERLRNRGTESEERIAERMRIAEGELAIMRKSGFSDYLLINGDFEQAVNSARAIIAAERQRFSRYYPAYLDELFAVHRATLS